ncbi:MAG: single-stranded DNA-binding protein [bacterium]
MGINKVILVGNLGRKPEMRYTSSGIPVANFSLATTERWGTDETGQKKEHTEWHRCVAWRKLAEICGQYLDKGTKVYIEGRIRRQEYTGQDGIKRWSFDIQVDNMEILTPKGVRESGPSEPAFSEFPDTSSGKPAGKASAEGGTPSPPDNVDLGEDITLEEDEDFYADN